MVQDDSYETRLKPVREKNSPTQSFFLLRESHLTNRNILPLSLPLPPSLPRCLSLSFPEHCTEFFLYLSQLRGVSAVSIFSALRQMLTIMDFYKCVLHNGHTNTDPGTWGSLTFPHSLWQHLRSFLLLNNKRADPVFPSSACYSYKALVRNVKPFTWICVVLLLIYPESSGTGGWCATVISKPMATC